MKRQLVMIAAFTALVSHLTGARAQTWVPGGPTNSWTSIASSADGSHLIVGAVAGRQVLLSTNYGANWRTSSLPAIEGRRSPPRPTGPASPPPVPPARCTFRPT